jgi:hypothetical protein
MGHQTLVHGYIRYTEGVERARLNREGIAALPEWSAEANPLVSRDMFAQPHHGYLGELIPFGRIYNGVEGHWQRWREDFEALLRTLYWDEVEVWVQTEFWGEFHCSWSRRAPEDEEITEEAREDASIGMSLDEPLEPTTHWLYRGPERTVVR